MAALNQHISAYVSDHEHAVQSLAAGLSGLPDDRARRQQLLAHYHDVYPGFITIFAADRQGIVREIFPPRDSESPPISDREYFINAVQTRQLAVPRKSSWDDSGTCPSSRLRCRFSTTPARSPAWRAARSISDKFERFVEAFRSLPSVQITVLD